MKLDLLTIVVNAVAAAITHNHLVPEGVSHATVYRTDFLRDHEGNPVFGVLVYSAHFETWAPAPSSDRQSREP